MTRKRSMNEIEKRPAIDWQMVRKRLDAVSETLNRGLTPAEEKDILKARARALAREPLPAASESELLNILEFSLAYETYGVEMAYVRETRPLRDVTPVPCTPPFVLGLINVRGRILSVIDIKRFFDLPEKGLTKAQSFERTRIGSVGVSSDGASFTTTAERRAASQAALLTPNRQPPG